MALLALAARFRWLAPSGLAASLAVGAAVWWGLGLTGLIPLCFFFATASFLTVGPGAPDRRRADRDPAGRTGGQVFANAGVAAIAATLVAAGVAAGRGGLASAGALAATGALAAATADTWATEIGWRIGAPTRSITSRIVLAPGETGGVSWSGTAAGAAGALCVASFGGLLVGPGAFWPAWAGGVTGMLVDSLIGATLERRFTRVTNDVVNWAGTISGAGVAVLFG